jgi:hypothetical protein
MDKLDLLAKYLVKEAANKDYKNMVKSAFIKNLFNSIKAHPWKWGLGTAGTIGGILLARNMLRGGGGVNEPPPITPDNDLKKLLDEASLKNKNIELGGGPVGVGGNLAPYGMEGGGIRGGGNKGFLGTIGSLVDPVISLTGRDPESVPNISKLLLLAGLTTGIASLFNRDSKWLPWTAGGLALAGLGSSLLLGSRPNQQQQMMLQPQVF